ncbi:MAG TPA: prepilin-type N-terminal cleavage/methylation domain-containing protein [Phycisphaerae bacterium]|nr:prepilin-type N-terminal cleavage/methylation domain-containing protein [Phycisphaerae bacterium]
MRCARRGVVRPGAFTLIELLAAISIIAILLAILLPSLSSARRTAKILVCQANLKGLMAGVFSYSASASDAIIPAYNTKGVSTGINNPLDGWGPILDKEGAVIGSRELRQNPFCCPDTRDIAGVAGTQTGLNPENPKGYMEWPAILTLSQNYGTTIPSRGFAKIMRVGYWINGDNELGAPRNFTPGLHFTSTPGYGPDAEGKIMGYCYFTRIKKPSQLIALADGLYSGKQDMTHQGDRDSRIGYRHSTNLANIAFADGHVASIDGQSFPRRRDAAPLDVIRAENLGEKPTVYTDPDTALKP